jgi:hypothetical protein
MHAHGAVFAEVKVDPLLEAFARAGFPYSIRTRFEMLARLGQTSCRRSRNEGPEPEPRPRGSHASYGALVAASKPTSRAVCSPQQIPEPYVRGDV